MVGPEGAKRVLAILAAHEAAAVGEPDLQGDQTVRTNRHKVRGLLAHGHFPRAGKSRELKQRIGSPSWWTISALDLFRKPREFQPAFILPAPACPKNRHGSSNPRRHWHCEISAKATAPGSRLIQGAVGWLSADLWVTNDHGLFFGRRRSGRMVAGRSLAQSAILRLSMRFLATTPMSTADQRITESGSGLLMIPPAELPDDEPALPLVPAVVDPAGGKTAVM
jgi:hypothetical protein